METFILNGTKTLNYRQWLSEEFTKRCRRNSKYSIRAFADLLGLNSSTVSQLLSGKRQASPKMVKRLCETLGVGPEQERALVNYANYKTYIKQDFDQEENKNSYRQLTLDAYALIADWYHYAILEITFVQDFKSEPKWIAAKLGITAAEAKIAIERLIRLELLKEHDGKLFKTETFITNFSNGVTSGALKKLQKSVLEMGLEAIDNTPKDEKDITSMTFAIDEKKIPEAREKIKKFRREMSELLESGNQTRVYNLGIQLYPISNK